MKDLSLTTVTLYLNLLCLFGGREGAPETQCTSSPSSATQPVEIQSTTQKCSHLVVIEKKSSFPLDEIFNELRVNYGLPICFEESGTYPASVMYDATMEVFNGPDPRKPEDRRPVIRLKPYTIRVEFEFSDGVVKNPGRLLQDILFQGREGNNSTIWI